MCLCHFRNSLALQCRNARVVGEDYKFIIEDAVLTTTAGNKSVTVTYEHNQLANILPNDGLEQRSLGASRRFEFFRVFREI